MLGTLLETVLGRPSNYKLPLRPGIGDSISKYGVGLHYRNLRHGNVLLGRYVLVDEPPSTFGHSRNSGSFVFRAADLETGDSDLVLKVFAPGIYDDATGYSGKHVVNTRNALVRAANEASALKHLKSLGERQVSEYIDDRMEWSQAYPVPVVITRFIPYQKLLEYKKQNNPDFDASMEIAINLGEVVERIHRAGIIHRDLHPVNVFVNPETRRPIVFDFDWSSFYRRGLAGIGRNDLDSGMDFHHLPPEEWHEEQLDFRADVYSLGCTIFYLLRDFFPIDWNRGSIEVKPEEKGLMNADFVWLGMASRKFPEKLRKIILAATAEDPKNRYNSVAEFVADLRAA